MRVKKLYKLRHLSLDADEPEVPVDPANQPHQPGIVTIGFLASVIAATSALAGDDAINKDYKQPPAAPTTWQAPGSNGVCLR